MIKERFKNVSKIISGSNIDYWIRFISYRKKYFILSQINIKLDANDLSSFITYFRSDTLFLKLAFILSSKGGKFLPK